MTYLDNASTSFPKPPEVLESITKYLTEFGVSPGRGEYHLAEQAEDLVEDTRGEIANLIGSEKLSRVIFTYNATHSLNLVIKGVLRKGDHALACSFSHNSIIRPLEKMKSEGLIDYDIYSIDPFGNMDLNAFESSITDRTRLVIANHVSNVLGTEAPIREIAEICKKKGVLFLLDCTQSLVYIPIDVNRIPIDFLAGTGHKSLLGPSGVGFLYVKNPKTINTSIEGGSGGNISLSPMHPNRMPFKLEAGTLHTTAIAGLNGGLKYLNRVGIDVVAKKSLDLLHYTWEGLRELDDVILYGPDIFQKRVPILSFNISRALPCEVAHIYDKQFGICLRSGTHCAPLVHKMMGTQPTGTLRLSLSHFNTYEEIDLFLEATKQILKEKQYAKTCA